MSSRNLAINAVKKFANRFESTKPRHRGILGDGLGTVAVPNRDGYVYFRRREAPDLTGSEPIAVRLVYGDIPLIDGYPVVVGEDNVVEGDQVLGRDVDELFAWFDKWFLRQHHEQHEFGNEEAGYDVVWVQKQQLLPLLVHPTSPASMSVKVYGGWYQWDTSWHYFETTTSANLSGYVPSFGEALFVLIGIDGATETLTYTPGDTFPIGWPPVDREDMIPAPPEGSIPLAAIYLPYGTIAIPWDNIYDVRLIFSGGGAMSIGAAPRDTSYITIGHNDILSAERIFATGSDLCLTDGGPDGTLTVGRSGNKILRFDSNGAVLTEFAATYTGLTEVLAVVVAGDVIWLPQCQIALEAAIVIPADVTLTGLSQPGTREPVRPWAPHLDPRGTEQFPKLYNNSFDASTITLQDGAVLEEVQVYRHAGTQGGAGVGSAVVVGDDAVARRCRVICYNNGTQAVAGIVLAGATSLAEDCVSIARADYAGGNDAHGIYVESGPARIRDCEAIATSSYGTACGLYLSGDCTLMGCIGDGDDIGLRVVSGTTTSRFGYYSGSTDLQVDSGATLNEYADQYTSKTINGTLTHLAGDRAGTRRDETITGDWNLNSGELGLPSGDAFPGAPQDGDIFYRTDEDKLYIYDGASWIEVGVGILHNELTGLQGGSAPNEYYHLDATAYAELSGGLGGLLHNDLGGLQGGQADEYYHLTQAQHTSFTVVAAAGNALVSTGANTWGADLTPLWLGTHTWGSGFAVMPTDATGQDLGDATHRWDLHTQAVFFEGTDGNNTITVLDNVVDALHIWDADGLEYMRIVSTDANPYVLFDPAAAGIDVGMGTAAPGAALHVESDATQFKITRAGNVASATLSTDAADNLIIDQATNASGGIIFRTRTNFAQQYKLHILDVGAIPTVRIYDWRDKTWVVGDIGSALEFWESDTSGNFPAVGIAVKTVAETTFGASWGMAFYTNANLADPTEKARITSAGVLRVLNLAGVGVRNVVADAAGNLSAP